MASTISAGTTSSTGLVATADTTGNLQLASNNGTVAVTIDTSQNVGVGTASPGSYGKLTVNDTAAKSIYVRSSSTNFSGLLLENTNSATKWQIGVEGGAFNTAGLLNIGIDAIGSKMAIDSSGNVGIGTSSPVAKLAVVGGTTNASNLATAYSSASFNINPKSTSGYSLQFGSGPGDLPYIQQSAGGAAAGDMTIQPYGGAVLVNTTTRNSSGVVEIKTTIGTDNALVLKTAESGAGGTATMMQTRYNATTVGSITCTSSATAYNTSSDYRLKENIFPMTGALERIKALKPVTYTWKADGSDGEGFIAHELAEVCPHAVNGEKDAVDVDGNPQYQGIDVSFLVATLTAAIQELTAKVTALEEQVLNLGVK